MPGLTQQVVQGSLNRLQASVTFIDPQWANLTVLPQNLGAEGIRLSFDDTATDLIPTMTGMVTSPKPFMGCTLTIALVKSAQNNVADNYKYQFVVGTLLGQVNVTPDVSNISKFTLYNMTLETIREMAFSGTEAVMIVTLRGYYPVNQDYFGDGYETNALITSTGIAAGNVPAAPIFGP
jgi:hypothetical protein